MVCVDRREREKERDTENGREKKSKRGLFFFWGKNAKPRSLLRGFEKKRERDRIQRNAHSTPRHNTKKIK